MKKLIKKLKKKIFWWRKDKKQFGTRYKKRYQKYDIGEYTYGAPVIYDYETESLKIGRYCSIGPNVTLILGGNHRTDWITTYPFNAKFHDFRHIDSHKPKGGLTIGNDVWIAANVTILSGVTVGNSSIIAAGSVVVKDVPAYAIVAGNPAKVVRMRFEQNVIEKLEATKWWEKSYQELKPYMELLMSGKAEEFIKEFK